MATYHVTAHRRYKVTYREVLEIQADSAEEAKQKAESGDIEDHISCDALMSETEFPISGYQAVSAVLKSTED